MSRFPQSYLFFCLDWPETTERIRQLNANAAQPGINRSGLNGLLVLMPDAKTLESFDEIAESILSTIFCLAKKNKILRQTRDLLLPKLISGVLDVSDLDIDVREGAA